MREEEEGEGRRYWWSEKKRQKEVFMGTLLTECFMLSLIRLIVYFSHGLVLPLKPYLKHHINMWPGGPVFDPAFIFLPWDWSELEKGSGSLPALGRVAADSKLRPAVGGLWMKSKISILEIIFKKVHLWLMSLPVQRLSLKNGHMGCWWEFAALRYTWECDLNSLPCNVLNRGNISAEGGLHACKETTCYGGWDKIKMYTAAEK